MATAVCLVVQRDPLQTAKQVVVSSSSQGAAFLFGLGAGWNAVEMVDRGTVFASRLNLVPGGRVEAMKAIRTQSKREFSEGKKKE